jgi:gliding motility-associated protein GldM
MAGGKLSPRQKMINMMYLVLTALLALNVSKEILDSFVTVNTGLENTKTTLREKMDATYKQFEALANENTAKYGASWQTASTVRDKASRLITHIDSIKVKVIAATEKLPVSAIIARDDLRGIDTIINLGHLKGKDVYDPLTQLLVGSEPKKPKEGEWSATELKLMLIEFRDHIKSLRPEDAALAANLDMVFNFDDRRDASGTMNNWESINFYHVPLAAGITILSKIQSDIRNAENEIVNRLLGDVEGKSFKFNTLVPIVQPQSSYVTVGSKYRANIFLGAYDNQNAPEVYIAGPGAKVDTAAKKIIGEAIKLPLEGAMAVLEQAASGAGLKTVSGIIKFKPVGGEEEVRVFETTYEVAAPNVVVSPTKMNVFYRGVDNPVEVSVAGYSAKDITASIDNGTMVKGSEGYIVRPGAGNEATVNVTVTNPDGSKKAMPGVKFRVKRVPDPVPVFAGKGPGDQTIARAEMMAGQGVVARMEGFDFDLKFEITEFTVVATIGGEVKDRVVKGNRMTEDAREMLGRVKTGQRIWIENVKAKGPDGSIRTLGTLALKVK